MNAVAMPDKPRTQAPAGIDAETLEQWLWDGSAVLIDVREAFEFAEERIPGATHVPLSSLDAAALPGRFPGKRLVFQCKAGSRSAQALKAADVAGVPAFQLAGGIDAWKAAGRATVAPQGGPRLPIMRQVQLIAGSLVLVGTVLGVLISPWALVIPAFVGTGLAFAGASGWCGLAMLLAVMPWNRSLAAGARSCSR